MHSEFVLFLQGVFFFIELVIYTPTCNSLIIHPQLLVIKNETVETTYYHENIPQLYENNSKEMLSIYFLCLLSILLPMQSSTSLLNTTDNDVRKV